MMLFLLVATSMISGSLCAVPAAKPYVESYKSIIQVKKDIGINVLTLDNSKVLLNDSRRHFVQITHVIYSIAYERGVSCLNRSYEDILEKAAPEIIAEPQKAVTIARQFNKDFTSITSELHRLISTIMYLNVSDVESDRLIDDVVVNNPTLYQKEVKLHFALGKAAEEFLKKKETFDKVSKNLTALRYVIKGAEELSNVIDALTSVIKIVYQRLLQC